jgi:SAM-dependent methyltransferase
MISGELLWLSPAFNGITSAIRLCLGVPMLSHGSSRANISRPLGINPGAWVAVGAMQIWTHCVAIQLGNLFMTVVERDLSAASSKGARQQFVCPVDKSPMHESGANLVCANGGHVYPIVNEIPVLINEAESVFRISDYTASDAYGDASGYGGSLDSSSGLKKAYRRFARRLSEAPVPGYNFDFISKILAEIPEAKILAIGSGDRQYRGDVTYTDVAFAKGISCICDSHDIPYPDKSFDAVVADSVLEHVCDPQRCVSEFMRILKPGGFVFASTPFLQPVHMGAYDFTRFTYLGHRRLFRHFDEIDSGPCGGPVYSGIHLFREQLLCLTDNHRAQTLLRLIGLLLTYPLRHLDRSFSKTSQSYNSSCAFFFLGRMREAPIPDRDLLKMFRGR